MSRSPLLHVRGLGVSFGSRGAETPAIDSLDFELYEGEVLAIVGESGSGKSLTVMSLLGLTRSPTTLISGTARYQGTDLLAASETELRRIRGAEIAMIFQDPMSSLHPVMRVGDQIAEQIVEHGDSRRAAAARSVELLRTLGIPRPETRARAFPFEMSGGMRQRAMIAMALSCDPKILIADEPTTALDVTIQAQILTELRRLQQAREMSMILVTHDLGVVGEVADRVAVMYAGQIVEYGTVKQVFAGPQHPYTWGLLGSTTRLDRPRVARLPAIVGSPPMIGEFASGCRFSDRCPHRFELCEAAPGLNQRAGEPGQLDRCWLPTSARRQLWRKTPGIGVSDGSTDAGGARDDGEREPVVTVEHLRVTFPIREGLALRKRRVHAVNDVSLAIYPGEALGLVGESGCGKTTLARAVVGLAAIEAGLIMVGGVDSSTATRAQRKRIRAMVRMVFQDPYGSLNPRRRVADIVANPLRRSGVPRAELPARVADLLTAVGLSPRYGERYPHELSGGQRQRIGTARAIASRPALVILDEPVSALDVSVRAQIINLLADLREELGISYLFVAHDLAAVRQVSDRVAVMYLGKVMELAPTERLFSRPRHPYTEALLDAVPEPDAWRAGRAERPPPVGEPANQLKPPPGCVFQARCRYATELCSRTEPPLVDYGDGQLAACHYPRNIGEAEPTPALSKASPLTASDLLPQPWAKQSAAIAAP